MKIISDLFGDFGQRFEREPIQTWNQRAPVKNGMVTFSHLDTNASVMKVPGIVTIEQTPQGFGLRYKTEQPVFGIWTRYEVPGFKTAPFVTIAFTDADPQELRLEDFHGNPVPHELGDLDVAIVTTFLTQRAQEKYAKMHGDTIF